MSEESKIELPISSTGYTGEKKNGLKHGIGSYTWTTGEKYDGMWKND